jgi:hypothetical protein
VAPLRNRKERDSTMRSTWDARGSIDAAPLFGDADAHGALRS